MTELALTSERREQLATLLDDEQRLRAEYPKVLEYLDTAARLPGAGDSRADAAFDVRFVHYVTGGQSVSDNPYWDIVSPSVSEYQGRRVVNGGRPEGSGRLAFAQVILQSVYAYAIPAPETIEWISGFCDSRPILELGAGRGYWAAQLDRAGLTVDAYELEPPDKTANVSFPHTEGQADIWYSVTGLDELRFGDRPNHVLFLCWPPGWGNAMASETLSAFELAGGKRLIYIGEPRGGKTGDDEFFDVLAARWILESVDPHFVSWWNLSDRAQGWVRR